MAYFKVTGLQQFVTAVRRAQLAEPKYLRSAFLEISTLVQNRARPRLDSLIVDHARSTGALESSLKAAATQKSASINLGTNSRTPYAGWWEFGGPRANSHRPPNREFKKDGRSLYPTLAENTQEIYILTEEVIQKLWKLIEAR